MSVLYLQIFLRMAAGAPLCAACLVGALFDSVGVLVQVGQVLQLEKVLGKSKLSKLSVDIGGGEPVQVVTNAGPPPKELQPTAMVTVRTYNCTKQAYMLLRCQ